MQLGIGKTEIRSPKIFLSNKWLKLSKQLPGCLLLDYPHATPHPYGRASARWSARRRRFHHWVRSCIRLMASSFATWRVIWLLVLWVGERETGKRTDRQRNSDCNIVLADKDWTDFVYLSVRYDW